MRRTWPWLKDLSRWLVEPRVVWLTLIVAAVALFFSLRRGATELDIRSAGLVLQWCGLGTVAYGVRRTRKLFGLPGWTDSVHDWLARFPRWRRHYIFEAAGGAYTLAGGDARGDVWNKVDPTAPLDVRVNALGKNVERLNERLSELQGEVVAGSREHREVLRREQEARAKADEEIRERLATAQTGGLNITVAGLVWLFLGVFLTTLAPEMAP